jgi:hypothetical protein
MIVSITRGWEYAKAVAVMLWPVRFLFLVLLAMIAILSVSQGQDALYGAIVEGDRRWWVFAAITGWAVQTWYWARFLLHLPLRGFPARRYGGSPFNHAFTLPWIDWIPRALGAAVFVVIAIFVLVASANSPCPENQDWCNGGGFWVWRCLCGPFWGVAYLLCAIAFLALTALRRRLLVRWHRPRLSFRDVTAATYRAAAGFALAWLALLCLGAASAICEFSPQFRQIASTAIVLVLFLASLWMLYRLRLPWGTTAFVLVLIAGNMMLFLVTIFFSAHAGMYFQPAVALILNAAIWAGATSFFLVLPGERLRLPVTTLFVAGMVVFSAIPAVIRWHSGEYDNHRVRPLGPPALALGEQDNRITLRQAFGAWKKQAPCLDDPCTARPMILVAAEGGASRSGYWVAMILSALEDAFNRSAKPGRTFHNSLFAISSVSGGSLGAAVYQRLVAHGTGKPQQLCRAGNSYSVCGQHVIEQDFLGAVFFSAFGPDLLQRLFPGNLLPDRAEPLEHAWELAWKRAVGTGDFAEAFRIRDRLDADWLPLLFLNGTSVKTGRRIMTSDIAIQPKCRSSDLAPGTPRSAEHHRLFLPDPTANSAEHGGAQLGAVSLYLAGRHAMGR